MGTRGRTSGAQLSVVSNVQITTVRRPEPPAHLDDIQAEVWVKTVGNMPADWFPPETHPLLESYCVHVAESRTLAEMIKAERAAMAFAKEAGEEYSPELYVTFLKEHERQCRAMSSLATRMRISQQATYDPKKVKTPGQAARKRLWDAD